MATTKMSQVPDDTILDVHADHMLVPLERLSTGPSIGFRMYSSSPDGCAMQVRTASAKRATVSTATLDPEAARAVRAWLALWLRSRGEHIDDAVAACVELIMGDGTSDSVQRSIDLARKALGVA